MTTLAQQIAALNLPPMTDEELAKFVGLTPAQWEKHKPSISSEERAAYEQMRAVEVLIPRWTAGIDPYPSDVSVNRRGRR